MIRKIFKVTLLLLLVAVCGVGYLGWSRVKNSRLDLDDVERREQKRLCRC